MKAQHTTGPWKAHIGQSRLSHVGPYVTDSMADVVALVDYQSIGDSELSNANARLIAAAPDLLAACQMALSCMAPEDNDATAQALRAAIAKAAGA